MPAESHDEILVVLKLLLRSQAGKRPISEDTRLLHDLNIGSDDVEEFLGEVHRKFGTRFDGFDYRLFFPNEELGNAEGWLRRMGFESPYKVLTVRHLADVIMQGAWFDPEDEPAPFIMGGVLRRTIVRGLAAVVFPIFFSLMMLALGEWVGEQAGMTRGLGVVVFGLPIALAITLRMWRKLPEN